MLLLHKVPFRLFGECKLRTITLKCIYFTLNFRTTCVLISTLIAEYFVLKMSMDKT